MANYTDLVIVCGLTPTGKTNGAPDALQFGIPVRGGELWEFSFYMTHKAADPNAQVIGSWAAFNLAGASMGVFSDGISYAPNGYLLDTVPAPPASPWTHYTMRHTIATASDGFTSDPAGGVIGYILPCIWWHAATPLRTRYIMGAMLTTVQGIGGAVAPLPPDVYLTLGVTSKTLASPKSILGP